MNFTKLVLGSAFATYVGMKSVNLLQASRYIQINGTVEVIKDNDNYISHFVIQRDKDNTKQKYDLDCFSPHIDSGFHGTILVKDNKVIDIVKAKVNWYLHITGGGPYLWVGHRTLFDSLFDSKIPCY